MARSLLRLSCLVLLTLAACQIRINAAVAEDGADFDKKIVEKLVQPTRLDCHQFPLDEAIKYLADFHDIPIALDLNELGKKKIAPTIPITEKTEGNPRLDDVLAKILGPLNLSFMIEGRALLVTSTTKAKSWQVSYAKQVGRAQ